MYNVLCSFFLNRSGNFGIISALLIPVLLLAAGVAIDIGNAMSARTQIQGAADAAATGALNDRSKGIVDALTQNITGALETAEQTAGELFLANLGATNRQYLKSHSISVQRDSSMVYSSVTFAAAVPTSFMAIFGRPFVEVSGIAKAKFAPEAFHDFYILLDNSPSMGIGAEPSDIAKLESRFDCAFACHNLNPKQQNTYRESKGTGINIRLDVVALALSSMIKRANDRQYANQYRMALYTFGAKAEAAGLTKIEPMTDRLDVVSAAASNITLMSLPYFGYGNHWFSDFDQILTSMKESIAGTASEGRQKVLLIISDGMNDSPKSAAKCKYRRFDRKTCWQPTDKTFCDKIKATGTRVAVLYTTFWPIRNDENYMNYIDPWQPKIADSLTSCASPGLFFEISATKGINDAMNALFAKIVSKPILTQ